MNKPLLPLIVVALTLLSCSSGPGAQHRSPPPVVFGGIDRSTDAFELNAANVADNTLSVSVSYAGGCRNHEFMLLVSTTFQVSPAIQLEAALIHDADDDPCEAWLTEQLRFDLRPIKRRYQETDNRESGIVYLRLRGHAGPLVYQF